MPLQHRYRPQSWEEVWGNSQAIAGLKAALGRKEDRPHAILTTGPAGTGKTTIARLIADTLSCAEADFKELNAAHFRGVDTAREMTRSAYMKPLSGSCRVWHLDECHQLTGDAQESILKILEEPPAHAYFILSTTEPQKLKASLKRRCHLVELAPLGDEELTSLLTEVLGAEVRKDFPEEALRLIIKDSGGSPGVALSFLDSVIELDGDDLTASIEQRINQKSQSIELCKALISGSKWPSIAPIVKGLQGEDPEKVRRHVMAYANTCAISGSKIAPRAGLLLMILRDHPTYDSGWPGLTASIFEFTGA